MPKTINRREALKEGSKGGPGIDFAVETITKRPTFTATLLADQTALEFFVDAVEWAGWDII
jgi:hypothetical protein